ncbi:MAG: hypothetical protein WCD79_12495 [Chthoniobacteraceae bacterium]
MPEHAPRPASPNAALRRLPRAFTLVELLLSVTLLVIIIAIVVQITNQTSNIWLSSTARIQSFQESRAGFEAMTRKLSQATLNTYYDYYNSANQARSQVTVGLSGTTALNALSAFIPATYDRYSDLHFISGAANVFQLQTSGTVATPIATQTQAVFFQAPLGYSASSSYQHLDNALNACGYFLRFDSANSSVPPHILNSPGYKPRYRFRLMEMDQPTEQLTVYSGIASPNAWFVQNAVSNSRVIAENVIALVLLPKLPASQDDPTQAGKGVSLAPNYNYNSRITPNAATDSSWPSANPAFPGDTFTTTTISGSASAGSRHSQLPPMMRLVMVVIDETSAARIQGSGTTPPSAINLNTTTLFTDATQLDADIQSVEDICNARPGNLTGNTVRLTHRVFSTDIIMRDAKWSNN